MALRSVAELLPHPFDELTLADVPDLLARAGEERETLFFERKSSVTNESLAKSCAAFANSLGGLLVIGVADADDAVVGIERRAAEAQVWIKDALRGHLLPLPSFRGKWLPLDETPDAHGVLLVLVPHSSITPHLLTRRGAIYVRNPGSSDPVPLGDQRLLLELVARGERAQERAKSEARASVSERPPELGMWQQLVIVPTGVADDHARRLFSPAGASRVLRMMYDVYGESSAPPWARGPVYSQHQVHYTRWRETYGDRRFELAAASADGAFAVGHGFAADNDDGVIEPEITSVLERSLTALREATLDLGGHGDLRVAWRLSIPDPIVFHARGKSARGLLDVTVERWAPLEDADGDSALVQDLIDEAARAGGIGPPDDTRD